MEDGKKTGDREKGMKSKIWKVVIALIAMGTAAMGLTISEPCLTVYENGQSPKTTSRIVPGERFGVVVEDSIGSIAKITDIQVAGDSLMIAVEKKSGSGKEKAGLPVVQCGDTVTIRRALLYRIIVVRIDTSTGLRKLKPTGKFRVFPLVRTSPSEAVENKPFDLNLTLGIGKDCVPSYQGSFAISENKIRVNYSQNGTSCMDCLGAECESLAYGPRIPVGKLEIGTYQVTMVDNADLNNPIVNLGSIVVYPGMEVEGSASVMQSAILEAFARPIAGMKITAVREILSCAPIEEKAETLNTTTNDLGLFTLDLAKTDGMYHIMASGNGYYPQKFRVAADTALGTVQFQMIPVKAAAKGHLDIVVTENGAPVESASVMLECMPSKVCPMGAAKISTMIVPPFIGYTNREGKAEVKGLSLYPFIEYEYQVQKKNGTDLVKGKTRLNAYDQNNLHVEMNPAGIEGLRLEGGASAHELRSRWISERELLVVRWRNREHESGSLSIFDVLGREVYRSPSLLLSPALVDTRRFSRGVYLLLLSRKGVTSKTSRIVISR